MTTQDVLILARQGFTAQQIAGLIQASPQPVAQPVPQPVAQPVPQPVQQPSTQPTPQHAPQPTPQPYNPYVPVYPVPQANDPILQAIQGLQTTIQSNALLNTQLPEPQSTDDILAEILNPKETK